MFLHIYLVTASLILLSSIISVIPVCGVVNLYYLVDVLCKIAEVMMISDERTDHSNYKNISVIASFLVLILSFLPVPQ